MGNINLNQLQQYTLFVGYKWEDAAARKGKINNYIYMILGHNYISCIHHFDMEGYLLTGVVLFNFSSNV